MNTLIPDLFKLVDAKLNIVEHILLNESPTNDYINYTTDPKWLLFLIKKGVNRYWVETEVLISYNHISWLKHLVIHRGSSSVFIRLCRISKMSLKKRPELYRLACNNGMIDNYNEQILEASIINGYLNDFIVYIENIKVLYPYIFKMIYEYGHQNIINYIEANYSYMVSSYRSDVVSGMIKCRNRTYDRELIKTMLVDIINNDHFNSYSKFLDLCSMYIEDLDWIISVFGTRCYNDFAIYMLDSALSTNNSTVVDYIIDLSINQLIKFDKNQCLELCIKHNSIANIHKILNSFKNPYSIELDYLDLSNTTIETINLIIPYLSTKLTAIDILKKLQYTHAYVLFCHLMQLI